MCVCQEFNIAETSAVELHIVVMSRFHARAIIRVEMKIHSGVV